MNIDKDTLEHMIEEYNELVSEYKKTGLSLEFYSELIDLFFMMKFLPQDMWDQLTAKYFRKLTIRGYDQAIQRRALNVFMKPNRYEKQLSGYHYSKKVPGLFVFAAPGAGKTTLAHKLNKKYSFDVAFDLDNIVYQNKDDNWVINKEFAINLMYCYPVLIGICKNWQEIIEDDRVLFAATLDITPAQVKANLVRRKAKEDYKWVDKAEATTLELQNKLPITTESELIEWIDMCLNAGTNIGPMKED